VGALAAEARVFQPESGHGAATHQGLTAVYNIIMQPVLVNMKMKKYEERYLHTKG